MADWLLDSDPALRWQVERDLLHLPEDVWLATRERVATEGFGAALLARQDADGQWAGGAFFPADTTPDEHGQPWTATTWALNDLRDWGLDAEVLGDTPERLADARWEYEDRPYWDGEVDCCINAWTLANGAWLDVDVSGIAQWFLDHQLADNGWNCEWIEGSTVSSVHSTLNSLKGLLRYEQETGGSEELAAARRRGQEHLLRRRVLFRSDGALIDPRMTEVFHPTRWFLTALSALDWFRAAAVHDGVRPDPRLADAVEFVRAARQSDGRWLQGHRLAGRVWFEIDAPVGEPSRWATLTALRVLSWWETRETA